MPRHKWLKEVDQAPEPSSIRRQKDRYLRELGLAHGNISGLFSDDEKAQKAILPSTQEELARRATSEQRREDVTEAMRVYRLLRPDAPPFYEEDAMLGMRAKMNKLMSEDDQAREMNDLSPAATKLSGGDPFQAYLPVVNPRAFLIALESVTASLADDLETMLFLIGRAKEELPEHDDPLRFKKLVDILFAQFPLKRDPSYVSEFIDAHWHTLRLLLPEAIADLPKDVVEDWLRGHLHRIRLNKRRGETKIFIHKSQKFQHDEYYNFAEDFPYDDDPMPGSLADERNLDFPLEKAHEYMDAFLGFLGDSATGKDAIRAVSEVPDLPEPCEESVSAASQFQDFVWDLEKVGLRNWLRMDINDLERFLPKAGPSSGDRDPLDTPLSLDNPDDCEVAWLMLRCAARGRANLLDFEKIDPYKLLHGLPARSVDEELAELPANKFLGDTELGELVDTYVARKRAKGNPVPSTENSWSGGADVRDIFKRELDFYRTAGPAEWFPTENKDGFTWRWRQPPNTFWDERRKVFIPQQRGVDPNLDLKEMRQHLLEMRRMGSMNKDGRLYYYRATVIVGNGRGVYGFGIGFANSPKEARTDGALKALQNLDFIDVDSGRMMCFPVQGKEYKATFQIIPRPIGRGLKANKKFLPLLYILGLDNCKVRFMNESPWFTRIRAIKRALDQVMSRRTLANMTGKRHALLVAPGDHWVHWPDRWFARTREPYDASARHTKLVRRHILLYKRRGNRIVTPKEVKPGWRRENWARWNNPLEHWIQHRRETQLYDPAKAKGSSDGAIPPPRSADDDRALLSMKAEAGTPKISENQSDTSLRTELNE
jgi:ribosomal protein S5